MAQFHPNGSYYVPAHLERAGPFNPNGNNGFNIEHLRNFNNAAPERRLRLRDAAGPRRLVRPRRVLPDAQQHRRRRCVDSVGGTTYGGTGVYGAQIGGVWDALLGEGRNFWFFASSDWHNRGSFGPDDRRSTQDFFPGEYQRNYTMVRNGGDRRRPRPQTIVDGLRTGNNFAASGQLIDRLAFVACAVPYAGAAGAIQRGRRELALDGGAAATPTSTRPAARRWARSSSCAPGARRRRRDRRARSGGHELLAVQLQQPVAAADRHHAAAEQAGARPRRRDPRPGHGLQEPGARRLRRRSGRDDLARRNPRPGHACRPPRRTPGGAAARPSTAATWTTVAARSASSR